MGIATSLKRHYVEMVSRQSSVVLVVKQGDAWLIAMKVVSDWGFSVATTFIERHSMENMWTLAHPLDDVDDIIEMADSLFGQEADGILTRDRNVFRKNVTLTATHQLFDKGREFLAVCRDFAPPEYGQGELLAYCWFDRGGYTTYSNEEISNAKFHHVDLSLPAKQRVRLINEMIDQHILWAHSWGIPVICSTSIRAEHTAFMKIHKKRGFTVNGSYAWIKTENGLKGLK